MENIHDMRRIGDRIGDIFTVADNYIINATPLLNYIAHQIEMAYTAGANGVTPSTTHKVLMNDTGEVAVKAAIYAKEKGFKQ